MAERFNVFETAVLDMQSADLTELSNMGWHFIEKRNMIWDREERLLEATKGMREKNYDLAAT